MTENNDHSHINSEKTLVAVFILTLVFLMVELVASYISNSLTLFADAIHMIQDVIAIGMAVVAVRIVKRPKNNDLTFGYKRAEVLSALFNGVGLFLISIFILYESISRINSPVEVQSTIMFGVAVIGLLINILGLLLLKEVQKENINSKGAFLHVLSDTLGSIGAIVASVLIFFTGQPIFDALISIVITVLILLSSYRITKQAINILMERTPHTLDIAQIKSKILEVPGIKSIHDTHAWSMSTDQYNFSCHVEITKECEPCDILNAITNLLTSEFNINHSTVQVEHEDKFVECGSC